MKNNKGFSLVELIVVIAIMAILAAVAVVGFSMYIPKAQQANDKQLISDIEYAMTLAGYNGDFAVGDSGYIFLTAEGNPIVAENDKIIAVMEATFGSNWQKEVALQYDGWTVNTALLEAARNGGSTVTNSIFVQQSNPTELLENVQTVTQAAAGTLGSQVKDADTYVNSLKLALGDGYLDLAAQTGLLECVEDESGNKTYSMPSGSIDASGNVSLSEEQQTQLSNLMVLSVADELKDLSQDDMAAIMSNQYSGDASVAAQFAVKYSVAKAADLNKGGNTTAFTQLNNDLQNVTGIGGETGIEGVLQRYGQNGGNADCNEYLFGSEEGGQQITQEALNNFEAVGAIMSGVSSVSGDYQNADSLKDANLFTSGGVSNYLNLYVSAAGLQLPENLPENGIVLVYQMGDDGVMHVFPLYS